MPYFTFKCPLNNDSEISILKNVLSLLSGNKWPPEEWQPGESRGPCHGGTEGVRGLWSPGSGG